MFWKIVFGVFGFDKVGEGFGIYGENWGDEIF